MIRWRHSLWRILGSRQLAIILIASLLLAALLVSLFPQMPEESSSQEMWLEAVSLRYGPATALLRALGMFDGYHSVWFLALLGGLLLNTLICTVQRLPRVWRSLTEPPVVQRPEAFYQGFAHRAEWIPGPLDQELVVAQDALERRRFRPRVEQDETGGSASLYAERGGWSQVGTLVSHLAAVLLIIVVVCRPALGWQETNLTVLPGEVHRVGHGYDLDVRAGEPIIEQEVTVPLAMLTGTLAVTKTVRINQPQTFRGVAFHLQSYGPAVQISTPEGTFGTALSGSQTQQVTIPAAGLMLRIAHRPEVGALYVEALAADGTLLGSGKVTDNQEIELEGIPITFNMTSYTVWQVSHDPTFGIALASGVLLLMAAVVSLWVPHRRLWIRMDVGGKAWMVGAGDWAEEFDTFATEITTACRLQGESDG